MPTVIPFPKENAQRTQDTCALTELIREELMHLSSNEYMISCILERMKPFIASIDYDLSLDVELTDENEDAMMELIPAVQKLQSRFDGIISDIISERILHEIHLFHIERATKM
ncbi:hypothetical protein LRP49_18675 [Enterovibrio sp. ZSDZ35]|uniref:Uncharacterized protein n=1 Tax=Enterovibrio qingdaonensis TaxID=2899818 RepID=A0ABT5QSD8_9GAMM|nr:hypothetical protein [Enterovibrio sp. ZSDZ35]MDD1783196.1 hypothetical protein [Enterovibrio sp. ZSDZ35]